MAKQQSQNLRNAKAAKNDEFYTQLADIEFEMSHYRQHFVGKTVFCNCDDPTWSNFWRYFHVNFADLGLKKLMATHYDHDGQPSYMMEYTGGNDLDVTVGVITPLVGDGDFRSEECVALLKQADIVVTNPPFSLFREYIAQLMFYNKKFLIIGNKNSITYKEFFPLLKSNKVWIGYGSPSEFDTHSGLTKKVQGLCRWFTNLDVQKRHELFFDPESVHAQYEGNEDKYPKYDNYDAINIDKTIDIPEDYYGLMGVPITFLDKYNPDEFEIVGYTAKDMGVDCLKFYDNLEQSLNGAPFVRNTKSARFSPMIVVDSRPERTCYRASNVNGYMIKTYGRIVIRRKII